MIPGPKYVLQTLVGFENHDPTKYREPAYSIAGRHNKKQNTNLLPGPKYMTCNMTRNGPYSNQSVIVIPRRTSVGKRVGPGPDKYLVDKLPNAKSSPTWYFTSGREKKMRHLIPGPKYMIESTIANNVPYFPSAPKWVMGVRPTTALGATVKGSPGPARYNAQNLDYVKKKAPEALLLGRRERLNKNEIKPGPDKYKPDNNVILKTCPAWVFGLKHSQKKALVRTPQDVKANINCVL
ncbi:outer dense fiber protein 3-like [Cimex lectularius]|uniref:Uncharacterized protein n=1 Tax=Cimex lectularius TaxID=79782 RepID=A0A8I6REE4_CIMLE|nr:outer dense fiber protein 3-like [Cimex lectularius]